MTLSARVFIDGLQMWNELLDDAGNEKWWYGVADAETDGYTDLVPSNQIRL